MKGDKKKFLSYYSPEILRKKEMPVNFEYAQFYTLDVKEDQSEEGMSTPSDEHFLGVEINDYQTNRFGVFSTLGKPISKIIQ